MNTATRILTLGLLLMLSGCTLGPGIGDHELVLVLGGKPNASIVIAEHPAPAAWLAAIEIQSAIFEITGCRLPILDDQQPTKGVTLIVGDSRRGRALGYTPDNLNKHEYLIEFTEQAIVLLGQDDAQSTGRPINYGAATGTPEQYNDVLLPGMFDRQGSLRAAYDFLERYCGVRYYSPKRFMTHFPEQAGQLSVRGGRLQREPAIKYTNGLSSDTHSDIAWPLQRGLYDNPSLDETLLFARRMRTGGERWYVNHTFMNLDYNSRYRAKDPSKPDAFIELRPEYFPPKGSRSHQLCYSSPGLAKQLAADAADFFDNTPDSNQGGLAGMAGKSDFFPVVPNDAAGYCDCKRCQAWLKLGEGRTAAPFNSGEASDYIFNFVNQVAREVKKTHPDKYVGALAYEGYFWAPETIELEPNVAVAPCLQVCWWWHKQTHDNEMRWYKQWVDHHRKNDLPLYLWNYYHHPEEVGALRGKHVFPQFNARQTAELVKMYAEDGVQGVLLCGWGEGLDFYLLMKLYDNPDQDIEVLLDEYFTNMFGPAAKPMQRFYNLIEEISNNPANYPDNTNALSQAIFWQHLGTQPRLDQLQGMIGRAYALAQTDLQRKRIAVWDRAVMQYIIKGREQFVADRKILLAKAPHETVAKGYIDPVGVSAANADRTPYTLITGHQMHEQTEGVFGSRLARLDIQTDADRHWHGTGNTWVEFNLGQLHDVAEIRIWNYQQHRGWGLSQRGMRNIVIQINRSMEIGGWQTIYKGELPMSNDRKPSGPELVLNNLSKECQFVRIKAVGDKPGEFNWATNGKDHATGLGQVRFYGQAID